MMLRHIVLFGFKPEVGEAQATQIVRRFEALRREVPGVDSFEWGVNSSPEGLNHGLTHCFVLTFGTAEARDAYLVHPAHVDFARWARAHIEAATVVDYWIENPSVTT
jgi:hypothetical protein